ncbi:hypothetical protein LE190_13515 [Massilia oculi]|uniref:Uncharacterized protein n=1 Tax=Massilia hydrophila TaxID=3044279 RepID=A0ABS7YB57_9BURK|nr:hypothetical protein [Massilia oculi]MCA1856938.1 hypothetical protein [Massilia oculi]
MDKHIRYRDKAYPNSKPQSPWLRQAEVENEAEYHPHSNTCGKKLKNSKNYVAHSAIAKGCNLIVSCKKLLSAIMPASCPIAGKTPTLLCCFS